MTVESLEKTLISEGLCGWYLNGGLLDETFTIDKISTGWEVHYSERGRKIGLKTFVSEDEACNYFLATMRSDSSTKK